MANLRAGGLTEIAGSPVVTAVDLAKGSEDLPPTDGLLYITENDDRVVVRPSGTEPKLKCYIEVIEPVAGGTVAAARVRAAQRLDAIKLAMQPAIGI